MHSRLWGLLGCLGNLKVKNLQCKIAWFCSVSEGFFSKGMSKKVKCSTHDACPTSVKATSQVAMMALGSKMHPNPSRRNRPTSDLTCRPTIVTNSSDKNLELAKVESSFWHAAPSTTVIRLRCRNKYRRLPLCLISQ